ncbi:hypothetical protein PM10SUCC1_08560 [Propionigenium maris DSM 9537]|uniref:Carboxypeptidase regulatory-like domain-containing protein n=1 Tax=Propionigenium maris DSM 9537 TaxID=1123000 RepID=A0A9W6GJM9_9FUSO|nr:fimbria/pilus outer membrane usher protein [Propionigenium maris]GLI55342.1 hypothetical protein PM10SUCC1_08560 [Propionigenium maris DSM 9537]
MNKFAKNIKFLRILIFIATTMEARSEDNYVLFTVKKYNHGFFRVIEEEKRYIGLEDFVEVIEGRITDTGSDLLVELSPVTSMRIDPERKTLTFKEEMIKVKDEDLMAVDEELYISIELLRRLGEVHYNKNDLLLEFKPDFKLRYEFEGDVRDERVIFDSLKKAEERKEERSVRRVENRLFSLGKVKGTYSNTDLETGEHRFDLDYTSRILGGQFATSIDTVDGKVSYWNHTYDQILEDKDIVVGETNSNLAYFPNSSFKGIAIKSDSYTKEFGRSTIDGFAATGSVVELYKNGSLYDYQTVKNGRYSFEDVRVNSTTEFTVRIYDESSNYTEEEIDLKSSRNLQEKGGYDYNLFLGETEEEEELRAGEVFYGITEDTTLGGGYLSLEDEYAEDFGQGSIIHKSDYLPLTYRFSSQSNGREADIMGNIYLEVLNYDIDYEFIEAESDIYDFESKRSLSAGSKHENFYYDLTYTEEDEKREYEVDLSYYYTNISFETGYIHRIEEDEGRSHIYRGRISAPLKGGARGIAEMDIIDEDEGTEIEYEVRLQNYTQKSPLEYAIFVRKDTEEVRGGLELSYDLVEGLTGIFNYSDSHGRFGVRAEKTIILDRMAVVSDALDDSWIYGRIYYDENLNGIYDSGEKLAEGTILFRDEEFDVREGEYFIGEVSSEHINEINISRFRVLPEWKAESDYIYVEGRAGTGQRIDIPLTRRGDIAGTLEGGQSTIRVYQGALLIREQESEADGFFILENLPYGNYIIKGGGLEAEYGVEEMERGEFLRLREEKSEESNTSDAYGI